MFAHVNASCDDLILVFQSRLEEGNPSLNLLKKVTSLLDKKDCTDNEVFFTANDPNFMI